MFFLKKNKNQVKEFEENGKRIYFDYFSFREVNSFFGFFICVTTLVVLLIGFYNKNFQWNQTTQWIFSLTIFLGIFFGYKFFTTDDFYYADLESRTIHQEKRSFGARSTAICCNFDNVTGVTTSASWEIESHGKNSSETIWFYRVTLITNNNRIMTRPIDYRHFIEARRDAKQYADLMGVPFIMGKEKRSPYIKGRWFGNRKIGFMEPWMHINFLERFSFFTF